MLVTLKLVTEVVPPSNPPPPPQLMQTFPTFRLPVTFKLPENEEVAVVPCTDKWVVMVVVAAWSWPPTSTLPEKVEVPAPVEEKRPEVEMLFEEPMVMSFGMEASFKPVKVPEMVGLEIVGETMVGEAR